MHYTYVLNNLGRLDEFDIALRVFIELEMHLNLSKQKMDSGLNGYGQQYMQLYNEING